MNKNNPHPSRIAQEQRTVAQMIRLYCRKKEGNRELCPQCRELLEYAHMRLSRCPFGEKKNTCRLCPIHCYKPAMEGVYTSIFQQTLRAAMPGTAQAIDFRQIIPFQRCCGVFGHNLPLAGNVYRQALSAAVQNKKSPHFTLGAYHFTYHQLK